MLFDLTLREPEVIFAYEPLYNVEILSYWDPVILPFPDIQLPYPITDPSLPIGKVLSIGLG